MKRSIIFLLLISLIFAAAACKKAGLTDNGSTYSSPGVYTTSYTAPSVSSEKTETSSEPTAFSSNPSKQPQKNESSSAVSEKPSSANGSSSQVSVHKPSGDTYYHCYEALSDGQKEMYCLMVDAIEKMESGCVWLGRGTSTDVAKAFISVRSDRPEFFWLSSEYIVKSSSDGRVGIVFEGENGAVSYNCSKTERDTMRAKLETRVSEILSSLPQNASAYELECAVHDLLCSSIEYDTNHKLKLTSYAALVEGRAVCEGYARAMQLLLQKLSIPCILVNGIADGQGHMWNMVKLENDWYHLDATWDDVIGSDLTVHGFFNMNDERVRSERTVDPDFSSLSGEDLISGVSCNISLPTASATELFYPYAEGFVLDDNIERSVLCIKQKLYDAIAANERHCEFYINSADTEIEAKYNLAHCIREVNKNSVKKINVTSILRAGKTAVLLIKYEGE